MQTARMPFGIKLLVVFFCFGLTMCWLSASLLAFPGSALEPVWKLNPEARTSLGALGGAGILLMITVGIACGTAAIGLGQRREWGRKLAIGILCVNLAGDTLNAVVRHDFRTLIGLPIGGGLILYLVSRRVRQFFARG